MAIRVTCPGCHKRFNVSDKFAGQKGPCPSCQREIEIPKPDEEVVVHTPEEFGPKGTQGKAVLKPIFRQETKITPIGLTIVIGSVVLVAVIAVILRSEEGDAPLPILALGALALAPPLVVGGYSFLRDDEFEPFSGKELWARAAICGVVYAGLWAVFAFVVKGYMLEGIELELFHLVVIVPIMIGVGAFACTLAMEFEFTNGLVHYGLYLLITVVLRLIMNLPAF